MKISMPKREKVSRPRLTPGHLPCICSFCMSMEQISNDLSGGPQSCWQSACDDFQQDFQELVGGPAQGPMVWPGGDDFPAGTGRRERTVDRQVLSSRGRSHGRDQ